MDLDATRCYRAISTRDRRFDGRFFTAVLTTGIYCRPVCPARTPRADNVRFYRSAAAAEEAGFRPCRRCRPEAAPGSPAWIGSPALVARALRLIADGGLDRADLPAFAERFGVGERQLTRLFSTHVGVAPGAVARSHRSALAQRLLADTALPVSQVAIAAGYESLRQLNHDLRRRTGQTPTSLRARSRGRAAPDPGKGLTLRLACRPPFDVTSLLRFLALRAVPGVEAVSDAGYWRTVRSGDSAATIGIRPGDDDASVMLTVDAPAPEALAGFVARARCLFDLDADPLAISAHLRSSPQLAPLVARRPGLRVPGAWDPFEVAVRIVLGQQVTVRGATTLAGRLVALLGERASGAACGALTHLFPLPEAVARADLVRIGLPRARARTLHRLAGGVASGEIELVAPRGVDDLVTRLTAIPGIGDWTAQFIALRACGEPDAFPAGDLGLRRSAAADGALLSPAALLRESEAWRPWRAYAAIHLWTQGGAR